MPDETPINTTENKPFENTPPVQPTPQPPTPSPETTTIQPDVEPTTSSLIDIKQKEIEIQKKKKRFKLLLIILIPTLILLLSTPFLISLYKRLFIKNIPVVQEVPKKEIDVDNLEVDKKVQYNSDNLYISLEYPEVAKLTDIPEPNQQIKKLEVVYEKQPDENSVFSKQLKEGYSFKVSTFLTTQRDLEEITNVKKEGLTASCPKTAIFTEIEETTADGVEGRTFEVTNCEGDYKLTYVVKNGLNYEFSQTYKGDVGYKQVYRAETEDILASVKFYPEKGEEGPLETYTDETYGFSFKHPKFDKNCCDITGPVSDAEKIVVLGDLTSFIDKENFDGFGVFVDRISGDQTFDSYVDTQKKTLIDDYVVVKGEAPNLEVKSLKIGIKDGVMLRGYSWRGNDLIYLNISNEETATKTVLVISIKNISGNEFAKKMNEIYKSFEYFKPKLY